MTTDDNTGRESSAASRRRGGLAREIALSLGAFAGLVCVLMALAALFLGITPLIFRSGSMAPAVDTGALALSKKTPAGDIEIGDIVNVTNAAGSGITHRVVAFKAAGTDSAQLVLKGDANADADVETYVVADAGRVFFSVAKLGYVVTWLSGPVAVFAGGILVGILLMIAWRPRGDKGSGRALESGRDAKHNSSATALIAVVAVGALAFAGTNTPTTLASRQDTAQATSGSFTTAARVPAPGALSCTNRSKGLLGLILYVDLGFQSVGAQDTYQLTLTKAGENPREFAITGTGAVGAVITQAVENGSLLELLPLPLAPTLDGVYVATVRTKSGTHFSLPSASVNVTMSNGILLGLLASARCGGAAAVARNAPATASTPPLTSSEAQSSSTPAPSTTSPSTAGPSTTGPSTTTGATQTTSVPPNTTSPAGQSPPVAAAPPPKTAVAPTTIAPTTIAPPVPANLVPPQASPSGAAVAKVVAVDGKPMLQITDSSGAVQYSAPISSNSEYGYGVVWASGGQLWILGPGQLIRLDNGGSGWSRTVVEPSATDRIPADIAARLK